MKRAIVSTIIRAAALGVFTVATAGTYAAKAPEHPATPDDEMRYKGAPIPIEKDKRLVTPTGKFNVYNTMHDIY